MKRDEGERLGMKWGGGEGKEGKEGRGKKGTAYPGQQSYPYRWTVLLRRCCHRLAGLLLRRTGLSSRLVRCCPLLGEVGRVGVRCG